jgi:hypothetical protein
MLGGKVDGITDDGTLVEVKNRQYKIFPIIPIYEKIQIHAYMFLTGISICRYIQSFKEQDVEQVHQFSHEFWKDIQEKCTDFVQLIDNLVTNEKMQDKLLTLGILNCCSDENL